MLCALSASVKFKEREDLTKNLERVAWLFAQRQTFLMTTSHRLVTSEQKLSDATWAVGRPLKDLYSLDSNSIEMPACEESQED